MYRVLTGVEWIYPIIMLKETPSSIVQIFGGTAFSVGNEINAKYRPHKVIKEYKVKYKPYVVSTNSGRYMVYSNFVRNCPIFLPLRYDCRTPFVAQYLSGNGFRTDIVQFFDIDEILARY